MAKSLGFGKVQISVNTESFAEHLQKYELVMNDWAEEKIKEKWINSPQIKELFTMAYSQLDIDSKLKYLKLDPDRSINEFVDAKNLKIRGSYSGRDCLPKVSKLFDMQDNYPKTLLTQEVLDTFEELKAAEKEKDEFRKRLEEANETDNVQIIQNFIDKYSEYDKLDEIIAKKEQIEKSKKEDRHREVNEKAKNAYNALQAKKGNAKQYQKEKEKFIKKWKAEKNNKGSQLILDLINKLG